MASAPSRLAQDKDTCTYHINPERRTYQHRRDGTRRDGTSCHHSEQAGCRDRETPGSLDAQLRHRPMSRNLFWTLSRPNEESQFSLASNCTHSRTSIRAARACVGQASAARSHPRSSALTMPILVLPRWLPGSRARYFLPAVHERQEV